MPRKAGGTGVGAGWLLTLLGVGIIACYLFVGDLSKQFIPHQSHEQRPILQVLAWLWVAFALYLGALVVVWRLPADADAGSRDVSGMTPARHRYLLYAIVAFAVLYRLVLLPSNPIQEIDIYRYLWDGQATCAGVNPFAYSPAQIERGHVSADDFPRLQRLLEHESAQEIFELVDHGQVHTVYPPASQATFALASALTPAESTLRTHVTVMKGVFLVFDLGTVLLLIALLRTLGKPPHWCLAYAWCPLVVKEFANSGHLDSQAVFFTTLAALLLVRGLRYAGAVAWAAAVLSKVFPLVLLPLIVRQLWLMSDQAQSRGQRLKNVGLPLLLALGLIAAAYFAVWPTTSQAEPTTPVQGFRVFMTEWKMNDLPFHLLQDAVDAAWGADSQKHFALNLGDWWPRQMATGAEDPGGPVRPSFILTYSLVGLMLLGLVMWFTSRPVPSGEAQDEGTNVAAEQFLTAIFYTLAILFLLSPTANPWYLTWAVPFLPWARQRAWFLLPGFVLHYYLWFWFNYHYPPPEWQEGERTIAGLSGPDFFNQVWLWVEFGPFYLLLAVELLWQWRKRKRRG